MESLNIYGQTNEWEDACVKTRRNTKRRSKRILEFGIKNADKVLDLGCGDGLNIMIFRENGIKNVIGIDISRNLVKIAQKNNPRNKFALGSAEKLPFKDGTFNIVFVDSVFHHLLKYDKAIKEIKRVLKKGGFLCFIEPHQSFARRVFDFITVLPLSSFLPFFKERRAAYFGEKHLMTHWLKTEDEFFSRLLSNGFEISFKRFSLLSVLGKYKKK